MMKIISIIRRTTLASVLLCTVIAVNAQTLAYNSIAPAGAGDVNTVAPEKTEAVATKTSPRFVFHTNGSIPDVKTEFEEPHYLGGEITKKWNTFKANYTHEYSVSVGLSNSGYEYIKPAVFNAVNRANKYVKKALKSRAMTKDEAVKKMSHLLDCANVILYEPDTSRFEEAAKDAKTGQDVVRLFDSVKLVN